MRLTKIDKANILKADSVRIVNQREDREIPLFLIELNNRLNVSVPYSSVSAARRAVRRIRTDLEPTTL